MIRVTRKMVQEAIDSTLKNWKYKAGLTKEEGLYCGFCTLAIILKNKLESNDYLKCRKFCPISDDASTCCTEYSEYGNAETEAESIKIAKKLVARIEKFDIPKIVATYNAYLKGLEK